MHCSNDIMQHLAESCRNRTSNHIGTDGRRMTSYGSTIATNHAQEDPGAARHAYDSIEAEIDQLKEDVLKLRKESDKDRTTPKTEQELAIEKYLSTRSGRRSPVNGEHVLESAATRLRRQHEAQMSVDAVCSDEEPKAQVTPSPIDFPVLGHSQLGGTATSVADHEAQQRRTSYADAATSGMMDAIDQAYRMKGKIRSDSKLSESNSTDITSANSHATTSTVSWAQTSSSAETKDSEECMKCETSVINIAEHAANDLCGELSYGHDGKSSTPDRKTVRQSPRFAQPTKSFARRTGETVRRESASVSPRSPAEASPTKSTKGKEPTLATTKRALQQQQKRRSLPGEWLNATTLPPEGTVSNVKPEAGNVTGYASWTSSGKDISSKSKEKHASYVSQPRENASATKSTKPEAQSQIPLRKKQSSYMAPTTAATQRKLATRSPEKAKREICQAKDIDIRAHVSQSTQDSLLLPRPPTAVSDASSVQFILDRPNGDAERGSNRAGERSLSYSAALKRSETQVKINAPAKKALVPVPSSTEITSSVLAKAQPSGTTQSLQQNNRPDPKLLDGLAPLPKVANTTTKRRTSHGHLLRPIVACLEAKGLLNKTSAGNAVVEAYLQGTTGDTLGDTLRSAPEKAPNTPSCCSEASSIDSYCQQTYAPTNKVVPPHLRRSRETSTASTSVVTTICEEQTIGERPGSLRRDFSSMSLPLRDDVNSTAMPCPGEVKPGLTQAATVPALRATAKEFKPTATLANDIALEYWPDALHYIPDHQWILMSSALRSKILAHRKRSRLQGWVPSNELLLGRATAGVTFKRNVRHSWDDIVGQIGRKDSPTSFVDENGSPHIVQAGQVLKPNISPGKRSVQWMLQDLNGKETPINFGRAPPPHVCGACEPSTPTISSTSADTSPVKTPHSVRRWQIGSTWSPNPYG